MWILYFVPKNLLSFIVGKIVQIRWPSPLGPWTVRWFVKRYHIDLSEAEKTFYPSIGALFVRRLKPGLRPISRSNYVHPTDSTLITSHPLEGNDLIQAKNKSYSLKELTRGTNQELSCLQGGWALTYYLSPTDYHRVHSPVDGEIRFCQYIPGRLWPVNPWSVENISQLFSVNERILIGIQTARGLLILVMVGATNVGRITLSFEPTIVTNRKHFCNSHRVDYTPTKSIKKGEELGVFNMGSTVIVLAAPGVTGSQSLVKTPLKVCLGESLKWTPSEI